MKHFLFRVDRKPRAHAFGTVYLWKIVKNEPILLGKRDFNYEGDLQAAFILAENLKALPKRYFEKSPTTSCHMHMYSDHHKFHQV